jgi:hypothetical protein
MSTGKKCPPGVICIENVTLVLCLIIFFIVIYIAYAFVLKGNRTSDSVKVNNNHNIVINDKQTERNNPGGWFGSWWAPSYPYTNLPGDVLLNPYVPPLRDERYMVPINVSTNIGAVDAAYRQVGILTPLNGSSKNEILALMGRPIFVNRNKWQYYTMSDRKNSVKLPIRYKGRNATNEYGVDKIYTGDVVYVEGYDKAFRVTEYENDVIRYMAI